MTAIRVVDGQQRRLARVGEDGDDDPVEDVRGAPDDVEVAVGDRVERARVDRDLHASPASCGPCAGRTSAPSRRSAAPARMLAARSGPAARRARSAWTTTTPPGATTRARRASSDARRATPCRRRAGRRGRRRTGRAGAPRRGRPQPGERVRAARPWPPASEPGRAARFAAMTRHGAGVPLDEHGRGRAPRQRLDPARAAAGEQVQDRGARRGPARGSRTASASPGRLSGRVPGPGAARRMPRARPGDHPAGVGHLRRRSPGRRRGRARSQPAAQLAVQAGLVAPGAGPRRRAGASAQPRARTASSRCSALERRDPQARQPALGEAEDVALAAQLEVLLGQLEPVRGLRRPP